MSWLLTILVGAALGVTYGAAVGGADVLASRVHGVAIALAIGGTVIEWARRQRWRGLVGFGAAKVATFVALAPDGELTAPLLTYPELRHIPGALEYFWAAPAILLALTMVEGWALSLTDRNEPLTETRLWAHRHRLAAIAGLILVTLGLWRLFRADYYLDQIHRHGHGPASGSLEDIGPPVLPRLYEELEAMGAEEHGEVRSTLVGIIQNIRYETVAAQRREVLITIIETTPATIDDQMVDKLAAALASEPLAEERQDMTNWLGELDYRMAVAVFCEAFPRVPEETWPDMFSIIGATIGHATRDSYNATASLYPWRGMSDQAIADRKAAMLSELRGCVTQTLADGLSSCEACEAAFVTRAAETLGTLGPLTADQRRSVLEGLSHLTDPFALSAALEVLAPQLGDDAADAVVASMIDDEASASTQNGVALWLAELDDPAPVERVICTVFGELHDQARARLLRSERLDLPRAGEPDCLAEELMAAAGKAFASPTTADQMMWTYRAIELLKARVEKQPHIADWAKNTHARHPDASHRHLLRDLADASSD